MHALASIPSPSSGTLDLGPFDLHLYGLTLVCAILLAVWIGGRRFVARGGDWDLISRLACWGVPAGIIGARAYHVATSWDQLPDVWWGPFAIWRGGLGVWGGIAAGTVVGIVIARRAGANVPVLADALAPAFVLAQGVGRLGNWWNQELYGRPTDLPWALEIDHPAGYATGTTFHPTFLYELTWNVLVAVLLVLVVERRLRPRPPALFAAYVALYCFGRFWIEQLRVDAAHDILGMRLNGWVALAGIVGGSIVYCRHRAIRNGG
ncbi:MAG: prolipoprotein diacylglyceryl transferase [Thermoleophilia bacterium]|nr:prolipoprotein diacylglyceryl transferase [Thermoleophilia bacterium]